MIKRLLRWISGNGNRNTFPVRVGGIFERMTPEGLCEVDPLSMDSDQIRRHLAGLYKRHNNAAGSLDPELRREAETMLDAIVHCREKYIDAGV